MNDLARPDGGDSGVPDRIVLAFYAAGEPASVALLAGGAVAARALPAGRQLERIASAARELLGAAAVAPGEVWRVTVAEGPGSFTGLRVGAAVALGFARATGAALHAVPTPEVWAALAVRTVSAGATCFVALRARLGEVHLRSYAGSGDVAARDAAPARPLEASRVLTLDEALARIGPADVVVGDGREALHEAGLPIRQPGFGVPPEPLARPLARLAALQPVAAGRRLEGFSLEYGREPLAAAARAARGAGSETGGEGGG